jgi:hypothetical protein
MDATWPLCGLTIVLMDSPSGGDKVHVGYATKRSLDPGRRTGWCPTICLGVRRGKWREDATRLKRDIVDGLDG